MKSGGIGARPVILLVQRTPRRKTTPSIIIKLALSLLSEIYSHRETCSGSGTGIGTQVFGAAPRLTLYTLCNSCNTIPVTRVDYIQYA